MAECFPNGLRTGSRRGIPGESPGGNPNGFFERGEILIARFDKPCELLWTARGPPAMVTVVGIFDIDNAPDMDKAVERLAAGGFDDTVFDEAIVRAGRYGHRRSCL